MPNYTILVQKKNKGVIEYDTALSVDAKTKTDALKTYIQYIYFYSSRKLTPKGKKLVKIYGASQLSSFDKYNFSELEVLAKKVIFHKTMPVVVVLTKELKPVPSLSVRDMNKIIESPRKVVVRRKKS
jgi:hypothetical protein